jgi:tripeptide aminopeptidase
MKCSDETVGAQLLERLLTYARIDTTSDRHADGTPSTPGQWELLRLLSAELARLGVPDITLDDHGFLVARIPATSGTVDEPPTIAFMAHVDTSSDVPSTSIRPIVHTGYDGSTIELADGSILDPAVDPMLARYVGETIVTSDGTTLLGADDKAGIAEMMTLAECLLNHPEIPHGEIELVFTPDEEIGHGMDHFPLDAIRATVCYTLDGSEEGVIETECFHAAKLDVVCTGISTHTGTARGKLVNAVSMLASLVSMLPRSESPEATDERFGFYAPIEMRGSVERSTGTILLRDFELGTVRRRADAVRAIAAAVEAAYPGGRVEVREEKQYSNMASRLEGDSRVVTYLEEAIRMTGIEPVRRLIRGGTDGSRLSEMGIPTPNIFTGGHNYHSRIEWAAVPAMIRAVRVLRNLCLLWSQQRDTLRS